jgi:hypothetical protein
LIFGVKILSNLLASMSEMLSFVLSMVKMAPLNREASFFFSPPLLQSGMCQERSGLRHPHRGRKTEIAIDCDFIWQSYH